MADVHKTLFSYLVSAMGLITFKNLNKTVSSMSIKLSLSWQLISECNMYRNMIVNCSKGSKSNPVFFLESFRLPLRNPTAEAQCLSSVKSMNLIHQGQHLLWYVITSDCSVFPYGGLNCLCLRLLSDFPGYFTGPTENKNATLRLFFHDCKW